MKTSRVLLTCALSLGSLWAFEARAQAPTCENVEFSETVLERTPRVREVCLRVEQTPEGKTIAVAEAEVTRVHRSNAVTVRFKLPDGTKSESRYFKLAPDRRFLIEGKETRARDLVVGQDLTIYVDVKEPQVATAPLANETAAFTPLELEAPADELPDVAAAMPKTASPLPAVGMLGALLLMLAGGLRLARRS